jgi:hypothetical protein
VQPFGNAIYFKAETMGEWLWDAPEGHKEWISFVYSFGIQLTLNGL